MATANCGRIVGDEVQVRLTALHAFVAQTNDDHFTHRVERGTIIRPEPRKPRGQLQQQRQELSFGEPQQEPGLPPGHSSKASLEVIF